MASVAASRMPSVMAPGGLVDGSPTPGNLGTFPRPLPELFGGEPASFFRSLLMPEDSSVLALGLVALCA